MRSSQKSNRSRGQASRRALIDALEPRRMLAVFNGTSGNDTIDIFNWAGGGMAIRINGVISTTTDTTITINGGSGNDAFDVNSTRSGVTFLVRGDAGNDTLINSNHDLDALYRGTFTFEGGTGFDAFYADNTLDAGTYTMELSGTNLNKTSGFQPMVEYSAIELLEYRDNDQGNLIQFRSMQFTGSYDVALSILANGGNDTIYNASDTASSNGFWDSAIGTGGAVIDCGTGTDTLQLSNTGNEGTNTYTFNLNTILGASNTANTGMLTYSACETVDFVCSGNDSQSAFNNTVRIFSKPASTALRIDGRAGDDTFTIGDLDSSDLLLSNTTLIGGAGNDQIIFDDVLDNQNDGTTSNYTFGNFTLAKGSFGVNYNTFETQRLNVANGFVSGFNLTPVVNLHATSAEIQNTVIVGGASRGASVNVGNGNLSTVNGTVDVRLNGGFLDWLTVNNQNATTAVGYQLSQTALLLPKQILYSGIGTFNVNGGSGNEAFFVDGVAAGTTLTLNGNNGNDSFTLGAGNLDANLLSPVIVNGGAGLNTATINNSADLSAESQLLNGATFIDGLGHTFSSLAKLTINSGPGGTNLAVNSTVFPTDINGGSGNDNFTVGNGDLDANLAAGSSQLLKIDGKGGTDSIHFDDRNDTNLDGFINFRRQGVFDELFIDDTNDYFIDWVEIESVTFDASNAEYPGSGNSASFIVVADCATPLKINGNGGPDSIQIQDATFPVIVDTGSGEDDSIVLNADLDAIPGEAILQQSDAVRDLHIFAGGKLHVTNGAVLNKTGTIPGNLTINGVLDLAGGALLSRAGSPLDFFQTRLARGFNGGAWNGTGTGGAINSSLAASSSLPDAVGYGLGSEIALNAIGPFSIAAGDTLMRYTYYGDADLNGVVNFDDYSRTDSGFLNNRTGWVNGNFNYDNVVNFDDYAVIDMAFNTQGSPLRPAGKGDYRAR